MTLGGAICAEQVSVDLSRDGSPMGRVIMSIFGDPPLGTQRFLQLAQRSAGGYRLSRVDGISDVSPATYAVMQAVLAET